MKSKLVWLTLPLLLCALVCGVKWRADHPVPTVEDLALQTLLTRPASVRAQHGLYQKKTYHCSLSADDGKLLASALYIDERLPHNWIPILGKQGILYVIYDFKQRQKDGTSGAIIYMALDQHRAKIDLVGRKGTSSSYEMTHLTMWRWLRILSNHPRLGPELKARILS